MGVIIFDLDNCLSNDEWRIQHIDWESEDSWERYFPYHSLAGFDEPGNAELLKTDHRIAIFTARPVAFRHLTEEWLKRNGINYEFLLMRPNFNTMASRWLKQQQTSALVNRFGVSMHEIERAYDDRQEVVEMYRSIGIEAHVATIHNINAFSKEGV